MVTSSGPSIGLSLRGTPPGRLGKNEDDLAGTRLLREYDTGCCGVSHRYFKCYPIKTLLYSESSKLVWWADRGRFVMHDVRSSDTTKTPRNTIRFTVLCMTASVMNGVELVWTGHSGGELCVWNERGQLIAKPCRVSKSPIRVICIANQETAWVGGDSGNIRVVTLNTEPKLAELHVQTTVVPGLAPVGRITSSNQWRRPTAIMTRPNVNAIDSVPEEQELQSGGSDAGRLVHRSTSSFASKITHTLHNFSLHSRAHSGHVRCIFVKGGRVWSSAGRVFPFGTIKMWDESDKSLLGKFLCESRGPCTSMKSTPWWQQAPRNQLRELESPDDWRLLTAHESGKILLWDPAMKQMQPLLEIEFRRSPIRAFAVFASLGLLCTCHGDGSVEVARLPTPQIRNLPGSQPVTAEDQIYPFVPRTISECLHPKGLRFAVGGNDCLFTVSSSGRILYWPKEKLEASLKILRQSSLRLPVEVVNESVMVIEYDQIDEGECIWEGDFAMVKKGKFLAKDVIIKVANENADSSKAMRAIVKDAHILATLRHPNIVNIMAVGVSPPFVVMQYYEEGSLYDVLKRARNNPRIAKRLTWEKRLDIAIGVACGMHFLNAQKPPIMHRDLKSPNIFVDKDFVSACVGDFNLSKDTPINVQNAVSSCKPSNPMWLAPEIVKGNSDFTVASDIYSFGMCMWELFTGLPPWEHLKTPGKQISKEAFYGRIRYELYEGHRPRIYRDESGALKESSAGKFPPGELFVKMIQHCMADKPQNRPGDFGMIVEDLETIKRKFMESRIEQSRAMNQRKASPSTTAKSPIRNVDPQRGPQSNVEMVNMTGSSHAKDKESVKMHAHPLGGAPIPTSPFDMPDPSTLVEEGATRTPPEMPPSPFTCDYSDQDPVIDPSKENLQNQKIANNGLQVGGVPLNPNSNGQMAYNPPAIARSPFDMPEIVDDSSSIGGQSTDISKSGEGLKNVIPQVVVPVAFPRSPFDIPMDDDG